jgi:hypothetical protein
MDRRRFLLTSVAGVVAWPLAAGAQQGERVYRIGLLTDLTWEPLREALRDLGYVEGKNIVFELRRSNGRSERWPEFAAELVRLKVDVIVTQGTPATLAAKQATPTIPIVMLGTGDHRACCEPRPTARQRHGVHAAWGRAGHETAGAPERNGTEAVSRRLPLEPG